MKRSAGNRRVVLTASVIGAAAFWALAGGGARAATGQPGATPTPQASSDQSKSQPPPSPIAIEQESFEAGPFTVDSVNRSDRKVVVDAPDGSQMTIDVSPNAVGFDNLKPGDRVDLDYYRSAVVGLKPSSGTSGGPTQAPSRPSSPQNAASSASANSTRAGGAPQRQVNASVRLTSIDAQRGTIQFTNNAGKPQTLQVQDPTLRQKLQSLKPGDRVDVTYTAPVAMSIRPSSAK